MHLLDGGEEWVHVPDSDRAAALIRERTPNLWVEHGHGLSIDAWRKQLLQERAGPAERTETS